MNQRLLAILLFGVPTITVGYPIDGYESTGIHRVEHVRLVQQDKIKGRKQPNGALLPSADVDLRLMDQPGLQLPEPAPDFTAEIVSLLGDKADRYALSVLDLSDKDKPRYADHRGDYRADA